MAITDKTRKLLWGRSGNRCAFCKNLLIVEATAHDEESVIAEECHIISSQHGGPRFDSSYPMEKHDLYENMILLCRIHHKMIDDQSETFTSDILRQIKSKHEEWVTKQLEKETVKVPVRIRRVKNNIPNILPRLTTGDEVLNIVSNAMGFSFQHDTLKNQDEVNLVGGFLQEAQDFGDFGNEMEAMERVETTYTLTNLLQELGDSGFFVFGAREQQFIEGGVLSEPSSWPIAILHILHKDNTNIRFGDLDDISVSEREKKL